MNIVDHAPMNPVAGVSKGTQLDDLLVPAGLPPHPVGVVLEMWSGVGVIVEGAMVVICSVAGAQED